MRGSELRAHIERKIATDELHRYPFPHPHPIVADFFPTEVYQEILWSLVDDGFERVEKYRECFALRFDELVLRTRLARAGSALTS